MSLMNEVSFHTIFFTWFRRSKDNPKSFGQITFYDEFEKIDVINVEDISRDDFKFIYDVFKLNNTRIDCVFEIE